MPASADDYELLDFGDGRKLERFGTVVLDRPCPTAEGVAPSRPELWPTATARYEAVRVGDGQWLPPVERWVPADWCFSHSGAVSFRLNLGALPSGQVGVFPEQADSWNWIARQVLNGSTEKSTGKASGTPLRVLNLFAYTGGSTLAAAAAGAKVVHVDAARNMVERAQENAALSGLADRPIRWICEDAQRFCRRELKRGNRYDAVILDPPSYGHGPKGETWKIGDDLFALLEVCGRLTAENRAFVLVTCHTPGIGPAEIAAYLADGIFGHCGQPPAAGELFLEAHDGRRLPSGVFARWPR
ncbi:MAG: class I SAM-dependent methyltransferase [Pirellulales bacterium]